jgi:hypothetical protein
VRTGKDNQRAQRNPAPVPLSPPQNSTYHDLESNLGCHGGKPATTHLTYDMALLNLLPFIQKLLLCIIYVLPSERVYVINYPYTGQHFPLGYA